MEAQWRGVEVKLSFFFIFGSTPRPLYPRERVPIPIEQEAGCASGPLWTCTVNIALTGVNIQDRQIHIGSIYHSPDRPVKFPVLNNVRVAVVLTKTFGIMSVIKFWLFWILHNNIW